MNRVGRRVSFIFFMFGIAALVVGGVYYGYVHRSKEQVAMNSEVILESIREVQKLATIQGHFSEILDYKDYYGYDVWPFRKKALVRVKADVLIGFDFEASRFQIDEESKVVRLGRLPESQILSIDHDLDYYDLTEGAFNRFTEEDFNKLSSEAKNVIRNQAEVSELRKLADEKLYQQLDLLQQLLSTVGWRLEYPPKA